MCTPGNSPHLWGKGSCDVFTPFQAILPLPKFDSDFGYHKLIEEAQKNAMRLEDVNQIAGDTFQHPRLDLASLLERKRGFHLGPSLEEGNILRGYIEECAQDIHAIHAKITDLITQIASLCNELTHTTSQLAQRSGQRALCQNILSPVKHLNLDVLEAIFLACWESRGSGTPSSLTPPLQLASVCYRWRDIVYSMPKLWSSIYIHSQPIKLDSSLALASTWLKRARCNVSMSLNLPSSMSLEHPPIAEFLAVLTASSVQFTRLELEIGEDTGAEKVMDLIWKDHCDGLEELKIRHDDPPQGIPVAVIKKLFLLQIPKSWLSSPPIQKDLTLLRLVGEVHWNVLEWILHHCPLLEKVLVSLSSSGLNLGSSTLELPTTTTPILQPHLVYMGISNDSQLESLPSIPTDFLSNFEFPSMKSFEYYVHLEQPAALPWLTSLPFLAQLQRVSLQLQFNAPREAIARFLNATQSLEELSVFAPSSDSHILRVLLEEVKSNLGFLPHLKRLHISSTSQMSNITATYLQLAQSWSSSPTLQWDLGSNSRFNLTHLTFHHWHREEGESDLEEDTQMRLDLKKTIEDIGKTPVENDEQPEGGTPGLRVGFVRHVLNEWLYNVPILFEMFPLSFNELRKYEVLGSNAKWETKTGPVYRCGDSEVDGVAGPIYNEN
ncbi:hypothetical protein BDN72DRAFT_300671 [Pluteus cervinus]|uniref:Uncharacterized protein n=1 Tax=Pluteus cervinus TaxID=181527 RepID=A0ACD3AD44_9AGAR|nr:hypothetical protein BDN72DRAFT_300671 [Pluteus cervinus]